MANIHNRHTSKIDLAIFVGIKLFEINDKKFFFDADPTGFRLIKVLFTAYREVKKKSGY
jgi:hypothetical protein